MCRIALNDHPEVRRIFASFHMEEVGVTYTVGGGGNAKTNRELIISN